MTRDTSKRLGAMFCPGGTIELSRDRATRDATPRPGGTIEAQRHGFTLIEVLLTLGVLVILASFAWPVLDRLQQSDRLTRSADRVRARWTGARATAIESGQLILFRYTPDGSRYRIQCQQDLQADDPNKPACLARLPLEQTLPEGVRFSAEQTPGQPSADRFNEPANAATPAEQGWSEPIQFCPDGTCSNADLELRNDHGWTIRLSLRGMTGVVTVGRAQSAQAAGRLGSPTESTP